MGNTSSQAEAPKPERIEGITYSETLILEGSCNAEPDQIFELVLDFNDEKIQELDNRLPVQILRVRLTQDGYFMGRVIGHRDARDPSMIRETGPMGMIKLKPVGKRTRIQLISYWPGIEWNIEYFKTLRDYILENVEFVLPNPGEVGWDIFWKCYYAYRKRIPLKEIALRFGFKYGYVRNMKSKYNKKKQNM